MQDWGVVLVVYIFLIDSLFVYIFLNCQFIFINFIFVYRLASLQSGPPVLLNPERVVPHSAEHR